MSVELLYTSAAQGLKQGSRGFCTVISTMGMPFNLATRLEGLSAYRHIYPPNHPDAAKNPINYSHIRINVGGRTVSILSRVADYGIDYSQRTNKLAHHVVVDAHEFTPAGPAWPMIHGSVLRNRWDGQCATPANGPQLPTQDQAGKVCTTWASICGDAGWGGVVADALAVGQGKPLWIIYDLTQRDQLLTLLNESIALLPHDKRWLATFSTYATNVPPDADCKVRCVPVGSDEARLAPALGKVIDLGKRMPVPVVSALVTAAREGIVVPQAATTGRPGARVTTTITQPQSSAYSVSDFELVEDEFNMKLQTLAPPNVAGAHLPPAPPVVKLRANPGPSNVPTASPHSNTWMKWALAGCLVVIVLLLVAGGVFFIQHANEKAALARNEAERAVAERNAVEAQLAAERQQAAKEKEPAETNKKANVDSDAKTEDDKLAADKAAQDAEEKRQREAQQAAEKQQADQLAKEEEESKRKALALKNQQEQEAKRKLEEEKQILIARVDLDQLLEKGVIRLKITITSPFNSEKRRIYFDELNGAAINLQGKAQMDIGRNSTAEEIKFESAEPLIISMIISLPKPELKTAGENVKKSWGKLTKSFEQWNSLRIQNLQLTFEPRSKGEAFLAFRLRLQSIDSQLKRIEDYIEEQEEKLNKGKRSDHRAILRSLSDHFTELCKHLDAISSDEVYESPPVFFHSPADRDMIPPGQPGREPFKIKYRIEHPSKIASSPSVSPEASSQDLPTDPQTVPPSNRQ